MSLPVPRSSALDTVDDARLIEMYEDATAWPLLGLLEGFDLQELFLRPPFRRRRVPPRAYAEETLRFCATCAREQRNADAVSWWMRDLNLPLVAVCPIHHTPLYIARIHQVLENDGKLPHELVGCSTRIDCRADDDAVQIANTVISLCKRGPLLDSMKVLQWIKEQDQYTHQSSVEHLRSSIAAKTAYFDVGCAPTASYNKFDPGRELEVRLAILIFGTAT